MTENEIKKVLYKEKPIARRYGIETSKDEHFYYETRTSIGNINFKVPIIDMQNKIFKDNEPAQLLIRWLNK